MTEYKKSYLLPQDMRFVNRIKNGWKAHRDYSYAYITDGKQEIRISLSCYNRLVIKDLAE